MAEALADLLEQLEYRTTQVERLKLKVEHLESVNASLLAVQEDDRKNFTRSAAIAIYTASMSEGSKPGITARGETTMVMFTPQTCWAAAKALWQAKPEDC